jgi:hypothetical protein
MADAFYTQTGASSFDSSPWTAGPWSAESQHAGPPCALLVRALEQFDPRAELRLGRVSVDILGPVPVAPLDIVVTPIKPGKRVELLEARASVRGRDVLIARAWRLTRVADDFPTTVRSDVPRSLPAPHTVSLPGAFMDGYMSAIDWRFASGSLDALGPSVVWARPTIPLLADEELTPWQRTLIVTDSASGVSLVADPRRHPIINCDLTVVLHSEPRDVWIQLEAQTTVLPGHGAVTHAVLGDLLGPVGHSLQTLSPGR